MNNTNHKNTEPAGADQPATKPANKAPAKDQPSTHVEGTPPVAGGRLFAFAKHNHAMRLRDFIISAILATISATSCLAGECCKSTYDKDVVVYEGSVGSTKVKITASTRPFSRDAHKTTERRDAGSEEKPDCMLATVDGKIPVGTEGDIPCEGTPQLSALTVWFGDRKVSVPVDHLHHVFKPHLDATFPKEGTISTRVAFSSDGKALYLNLGLAEAGAASTYGMLIRADGTVTNKLFLWGP